MKTSLIFILLSYLIAVTPSTAQQIDIEKLKDCYSKLTSVSFSSTVDATIDDFFYKEMKPQIPTAERHWVTSGEYLYKGDNFFLHASRPKGDANAGFDYDFAYDGNTASLLKEHRISVSKKNLNFEAEFWDVEAFFLPLCFVKTSEIPDECKSWSVSIGSRMPLADIPDLLQKIIHNSTIDKDPKDQSISILSSDYPNGLNLKVKLDPKNLNYPSEFTISRGNIPLRHYQSTTIDYVSDKKGDLSLPYAKEFVYELFDESGKLARRDIDTITRIEINQDIPDEAFIIDPSQAKRIYDLDNHTIINVPN